MEQMDRITEIVHLLPEEIVVPELTDCRPYDGDSRREFERLEKLAESIRQEGQLQPALVREVTRGGKLEYELVAGRRRREAIALLNAEKNAQPYKLACKVERNVDDKSAFRKAMMENIHRKDFSPVDLAMDIVRIRERFGWLAPKDTRQVAAFLGVSPAQITQHEKILSLPEDVRDRIHEGELSAQAAFDLLAVKPEKRAEVLERAAEKQRQEEEKKEAAQPEARKGSAKLPSGPPEKGKIKRQSILSAARQVEGALEKPKPRTRAEIMEFFAGMDGPAYGHPDGQVRKFVIYLVDKWARGEGSDAHLTRLWDAMVAKADRGTEPANHQSKKAAKTA